jgi:hypothetical protein
MILARLQVWKCLSLFQIIECTALSKNRDYCFTEKFREKEYNSTEQTIFKIGVQFRALVLLYPSVVLSFCWETQEKSELPTRFII